MIKKKRLLLTIISIIMIVPISFIIATMSEAALTYSVRRNDVLIGAFVVLVCMLIRYAIDRMIIREVEAEQEKKAEEEADNSESENNENVIADLYDIKKNDEDNNEDIDDIVLTDTEGKVIDKKIDNDNNKKTVKKKKRNKKSGKTDDEDESEKEADETDLDDGTIEDVEDGDSDDEEYDDNESGSIRSLLLNIIIYVIAAVLLVGILFLYSKEWISLVLAITGITFIAIVLLEKNINKNLCFYRQDDEETFIDEDIEELNETKRKEAISKIENGNIQFDDSTNENTDGDDYEIELEEVTTDKKTKTYKLDGDNSSKNEKEIKSNKEKSEEDNNGKLNKKKKKKEPTGEIEKETEEKTEEETEEIKEIAEDIEVKEIIDDEDNIHKRNSNTGAVVFASILRTIAHVLPIILVMLVFGDLQAKNFTGPYYMLIIVLSILSAGLETVSQSLSDKSKETIQNLPLREEGDSRRLTDEVSYILISIFLTLFLCHRSILIGLVFLLAAYLILAIIPIAYDNWGTGGTKAVNRAKITMSRLVSRVFTLIMILLAVWKLSYGAVWEIDYLVILSIAVGAIGYMADK